VPRAQETAFDDAVRRATAMGSTALVSLSASIPAPFSFFYTHIQGVARCFDLFDACDESIWLQSLPFSTLYVFASVDIAQRVQALFPKLLFPLENDGCDVLLLRMWCVLQFIVRFSFHLLTLFAMFSAQCCAYQAQYPQNRVQVQPIKVTAKVLPNFYSASLCRKNNISHLKKQRSQRPTVPARTVATKVATDSTSDTSPSPEPATDEHIQPDSAGVERSMASLESGPIQPSLVSFLDSLSDAALSTFAVLSASQGGVYSENTKTADKFRASLGLQMLSQHRFRDFRVYLKECGGIVRCGDVSLFHYCRFLIRFSCQLAQNRRTDPIRAIRLDILHVLSIFTETMELSLFCCRSHMYCAADEHSQTHSHFEGPLAVLPFFSSRDKKLDQLSKSYLDMSDVDHMVQRFETILHDITKPIPMVAPALHVSYRILNIWTRVARVNCAQLVGISQSVLHYQSGQNATLMDIQRDICLVLDDLHALQDLETKKAIADGHGNEPSPLNLSIVHAELGLIWLLAVVSSRVRDIRRRIHYLRHSESKRERTPPEHRTESPASFAAIATSEALRQVELPDSHMLDPDQLYQRGISFALAHAGGQFDLHRMEDVRNLMTNLPSDTVLLASMPLFLSQALDEVSYALTQEKADPSYAFTSEQVYAFGDISYTPDVYASPQYTESDINSMLNWTLCFDHDVEPCPAFFFSPFNKLIVALFFTPPAVDLRSADEPIVSRTIAQRQADLGERLSARRGDAWRSMPVSTESAPDMSFDVHTVPRSQRNLRGVRLMQLVLGLSQKLEDPFATAFCVLHLAQMLIYWCPHYELALEMLERLVEQCDQILHNLPTGVGLEFERNFVLMCQGQADLTCKQLKQHLAARLPSPFYVGTLVSLDFGAAGRTDGVLCGVDVASPQVLICQHPQQGLVWTHLSHAADIATVCERPSMWSNIDRDIPFDAPLLSTLYSNFHRALIHEFRMGRYSFARMVSDVRVRESVGSE
jgi:hypothetical protein